MPKSLPHDLKVGAAGEQPRGVRMPQIVQADMNLQVRQLQRWQPHTQPEPLGRDVTVGVERP
jgi:hypothetical protein